MSDQKLRDLERRWKETGTVEDEAAYLLERVRVGDLTRERLELAAYCGHEGARGALGTRPVSFKGAQQWVRGAQDRFGPQVGLRAMLYLLARTAPSSTSHDDLALARTVLEEGLRLLKGDTSNADALSNGADSLMYQADASHRADVQAWLMSTGYVAYALFHRWKPNWAGKGDPVSSLPDTLPSVALNDLSAWAITGIDQS